MLMCFVDSTDDTRLFAAGAHASGHRVASAGSCLPCVRCAIRVSQPNNTHHDYELMCSASIRKPRYSKPVAEGRCADNCARCCGGIPPYGFPREHTAKRYAAEDSECVQQAWRRRPGQLRRVWMK